MFSRIDLKILTVVGSVITLGLASLVWFYSAQEERNILAQERRTLLSVVESTKRALETLMLSGYGDIGPVFSDSTRNMGPNTTLHILRPDGNEAFTDNQTILKVNAINGYDLFPLKKQEKQNRILFVDNPNLVMLRHDLQQLEYIESAANGERFYTLLSPILHQAKCAECHDQEDGLRGAIKLTTSLAQVDAAIQTSRLQSLAILLATVAVVIVLIALFIRSKLVTPIQHITEAMLKATSGDLEQRVPVPRDMELGVMADSFNNMTSELATLYSGLKRERNKLTTIILGAQEGMIATDQNGQVVLVNPAAEKLLEKSFDTIAGAGFTEIFDDPAWMINQLQEAESGVTLSTLRSYKKRQLKLQLARIKNEQQEPIGSAMLIRDVTQEMELQERLRLQSTTDALTGLFNRRYFDEHMEREIGLSQRYQRPLSLLLLDIDHFKQFNDQHGHEQGDRVLQQVAATVKNTVRSIDMPCRYGGEEFAIIMPDASSEIAGHAAEMLRLAIERQQVDGLGVTASFGVACRPEVNADSTEALFKAADQALYRAKEAGRNRVGRAAKDV